MGVHYHRSHHVRDSLLRLLRSDTGESLHGCHVRYLLTGDNHRASGYWSPIVRLRGHDQTEPRQLRQRTLRQEVQRFCGQSY